MKPIWPHTRINIGQARVACIYHEGLEKYIRVCKYEEYKIYMWVEVAFCNLDKLYMRCCYIPHKESNYYNLYDLDHDYSFLTYVLTFLHMRISESVGYQRFYC